MGRRNGRASSEEYAVWRFRATTGVWTMMVTSTGTSAVNPCGIARDNEIYDASPKG